MIKFDEDGFLIKQKINIKVKLNEADGVYYPDLKEMKENKLKVNKIKKKVKKEWKKKKERKKYQKII